jgi:hypothetical protein
MCAIIERNQEEQTVWKSRESCEASTAWFYEIKENWNG